MMTVSDCLALPELHEARLLAGQDGLTRTVRLAHVVDEPDIRRWVAPEVVVLTTAHNHPAEETFWAQLFRDLAEEHVAALMIALGRYLPEIPPSALKVADALDLPVIALPWTLPFVRVTDAIHRRIIADHATSWTQVAELEVQVAEAAVHARTLDDLLAIFSRLLGHPISLGEPGRDEPDTPVHRFPLPAPTLQKWTLWVQSADLAEPQSIVARQMAGVLAVWLLQQKLAKQTEFEVQATVLDRLLSGQWDDTSLARDRLRLLGINPERRYRLLLLTLPDPLAPQSGMHAQIFDTARDIVTQSLGERLLLMTTHSLGMTALLRDFPRDHWEPLLSRFFHRFPLSVGILSAPGRLTEMAPVQRTMSQMAPLMAGGQLHDMSDALLPAIVISLPPDLMQALVAATWDRLADPVLRDTLLALIRVGGHRSEAATALGVHRNTITNRIEQIEALLGRPLDASFLGQLDLAFQWLRTRSTPPRGV